MNTTTMIQALLEFSDSFLPDFTITVFHHGALQNTGGKRRPLRLYSRLLFRVIYGGRLAGCAGIFHDLYRISPDLQPFSRYLEPYQGYFSTDQ